MAYLVENDLLADLPSSFLQQALNDGPDGPISFTVLAERASEKVDAILVQRVSVPVGSDEDGFLIAKEAARVFALETCYRRRGYFGDQNPWTDAAKAQEKKLTAIIEKNQPFAAGAANKKPSVSAITQAARTNSTILSA